MELLRLDLVFPSRVCLDSRCTVNIYVQKSLLRSSMQQKSIRKRTSFSCKKLEGGRRVFSSSDIAHVLTFLHDSELPYVYTTCATVAPVEDDEHSNVYLILVNWCLCWRMLSVLVGKKEIKRKFMVFQLTKEVG